MEVALAAKTNHAGEGYDEAEGYNYDDIGYYDAGGYDDGGYDDGGYDRYEYDEETYGAGDYHDPQADGGARRLQKIVVTQAAKKNTPKSNDASPSRSSPSRSRADNKDASKKFSAGRMPAKAVDQGKARAAREAEVADNARIPLRTMRSEKKRTRPGLIGRAQDFVGGLSVPGTNLLTDNSDKSAVDDKNQTGAGAAKRKAAGKTSAISGTGTSRRETLSPSRNADNYMGAADGAGDALALAMQGVSGAVAGVQDVAARTLAGQPVKSQDEMLHELEREFGGHLDEEEEEEVDDPNYDPYWSGQGYDAAQDMLGYKGGKNGINYTSSEKNRDDQTYSSAPYAQQFGRGPCRQPREAAVVESNTAEGGYEDYNTSENGEREFGDGYYNDGGEYEYHDYEEGAQDDAEREYDDYDAEGGDNDFVPKISFTRRRDQAEMLGGQEEFEHTHDEHEELHSLELEKIAPMIPEHYGDFDFENYGFFLVALDVGVGTVGPDRRLEANENDRKIEDLGFRVARSRNAKPGTLEHQCPKVRSLVEHGWGYNHLLEKGDLIVWIGHFLARHLRQREIREKLAKERPLQIIFARRVAAVWEA
ncbi:unnamed protein product [Amoebophrya sp. A25]|nr:unnamed protein product [Amoebophrya sp. A25]|eukprot:GSA25T00000041001.1